MSVAIDQGVQWVTASPLWTDAVKATATAPVVIQRPALLRFTSDTFMEDLMATLERQPTDLSQHVAKKVSHRLPPPGAPAGWAPKLPQVKLYQAFHGDFNLVSASLVCRMPGMPDHTLKPADDEKVAFLLRRLGTDESGGVVEMAWGDAAAGSHEKAWVPLTSAQTLSPAPGEELHPMFPLNFTDKERKRRLFVGLIPTSSGETFYPAGKMNPFPSPEGAAALPPSTFDERKDTLETRVIEPLTFLMGPQGGPKPPNGMRSPLMPAAVTAAQQEEVSLFVLLDLAELLATHLAPLWNQIVSSTWPSPGSARNLYDELGKEADTVRGTTWRQALKQVWDARMVITGEEEGSVALKCNLKLSEIPPSTLRDLVVAALPATPIGSGTPAAVTPVRPKVPKLDTSGRTSYRIRCVYRRPNCRLGTDLVSPPTEDFVIANLFDPDAPARQFSIPLPVDTSIKDLRKFRKNVGFLISNQLGEQMNRITDLKKALDGDMGEEGSWELGMICSFSIPIITICALIILFVFLFLLNIVFFWLPSFKICLPIPLRSKK